MNAVPLPLVPVGKDCDCGHPLVWYGDQQRCAVYGTHPAPGQLIHFRPGRPGASPVDVLLHDLATLPCLASRSVRHRQRNAERRRARAERDEGAGAA